jgi:cold shock CspA family protein
MTTKIRDYGVVSFWRKSFGFIRGDHGNHSSDIFFHISNLTDSQEFVRPGMRVSYRTEPDRRNPKKFRAVDVTVHLGGR